MLGYVIKLVCTPSLKAIPFYATARHGPGAISPYKPICTSLSTKSQPQVGTKTTDPHTFCGPLSGVSQETLSPVLQGEAHHHKSLGTPSDCV